MTELFNNVVTYLHDVFVIKFDAWAKGGPKPVKAE